MFGLFPPRLCRCLSAGARSGRGFPFVKICYQNQPRIQPARHSLCAGSGVVARAQGFSHWYFQIRNTILMAFTLSRRINKLSSPEPWAVCPCTSYLHHHQHQQQFVISDEPQWTTCWNERSLRFNVDSSGFLQRTVSSECCTWKKSKATVEL